MSRIDCFALIASIVSHCGSLLKASNALTCWRARTVRVEREEEREKRRDRRGEREEEREKRRDRRGEREEEREKRRERRGESAFNA